MAGGVRRLWPCLRLVAAFAGGRIYLPWRRLYDKRDIVFSSLLVFIVFEGTGSSIAVRFMMRVICHSKRTFERPPLPPLRAVPPPIRRCRRDHQWCDEASDLLSVDVVRLFVDGVCFPFLRCVVIAEELLVDRLALCFFEPWPVRLQHRRAGAATLRDGAGRGAAGAAAAELQQQQLSFSEQLLPRSQSAVVDGHGQLTLQ